MTLRLKIVYIFCILMIIWITLQFKHLNQIHQLHKNSINTENQPQNNNNNNFNDLITFKACNGFANQRISIVYGILIAINLRKILVLPRLPLDGTQKTGEVQIDSSYGTSEQFSLIYDFEKLKSFLSGLNLEVWEIDDFPGVKFQNVNCPGLDLFSCLENMKNQNQNQNSNQNQNQNQNLNLNSNFAQNQLPLDFGCAFPSDLIKKELVFQQAGLVKGILENLVPINKYIDMVQQIQDGIYNINKDKKYNLVHLRLEQDWIDHCQRWSNIPDGIVRDNCMNNTETLGHQLQLKNIKTTTPLYIATQASEASSYLLSRVLQNLQYNGYTKYLIKEDIIKTLKIFQLPREIAALIDYFLAMNAEKFVGNSVSSFSALILLEREFQSKWGSYYNAGNVPMATFIPMYKVPWILYMRCDNLEFFNQVTSIGIQSIVYYGNVELFIFCIGQIHDEIFEILKNFNDVNIITKQRVVNFIRNPDEFSNLQFLYGILMLDEFSKYNYVVFSGPKIFARKRISLEDFFLPLPKNSATYFNSDKKFTGLMIVNVEFIRTGFLNSGLNFFDHLVSNKNIEIRTDSKLIESIQQIDENFNARIITLNQLSLMDLEKFLKNGKCPQNIPCDQILQTSCKYLVEMLVFSNLPHSYPLLLKYCNLKLVA